MSRKSALAAEADTAAVAATWCSWPFIIVGLIGSSLQAQIGQHSRSMGLERATLRMRYAVYSRQQEEEEQEK